MLTIDNYITETLQIKEELLGLFGKTDSLVIFDIGSCEAEDAIKYSNLFINATIHAFEPRTDNCIKAKHNIEYYNKTRQVFLYQIALSDKQGEAEFFISSGSPSGENNNSNWNYGNKSSSLLPPSEKIKTAISWLQFNQSIVVQTQTLSAFCSNNNIAHIDFIHIDVQGAELMILKGASEFLKNVKSIWMEVEEVELYKNQPLRKEVELFMKHNNFVQVNSTVDNISGDQFYISKYHFKAADIRKQKFISKKKKIMKNVRSLYYRIRNFFSNQN